MQELTNVDVQRALATFPKRFVSVRVYAPIELTARGSTLPVEALPPAALEVFNVELNHGRLRTGYSCDVHGTLSSLPMFKTLRNALRVPDAYNIKYPVRGNQWTPPPRSKRITLQVDLTCLPIVDVDEGALEASDRADDDAQFAERQVELWSIRARLLRDRDMGRDVG